MSPRFYCLDPDYRVYPIRGLLGYFHLLHDASRNQAVLIDTGLVGEMWLLRRTLKEIGVAWRDIQAILLTHGHMIIRGTWPTLSNSAAPQSARTLPSKRTLTEPFHIAGQAAYAERSKLAGAC